VHLIDDMRFSASDICSATICYLSRYKEHGGEEYDWGDVVSDIRYSDWEQPEDPAAWNDWVECLWNGRGIRSVSHSENGELSAVYLSDGSIGHVLVVPFRSSVFTFPDAAQSQDLGRFDLRYSEASSFTLFSAYVSWAGWADETTTINTLVEGLTDLRDHKASPVFTSLWSDYFVG
jgi:hypothetical protein